MAAVLTGASTLVCPHGFPMVATPGQRLLTVDGQAVLVESDLLAATFSCSAGSAKCTKVDRITGGLSTTLRVGDEPVALATVTGTSDGKPPTSWHVVSVNQSALEAA
jgi:hypothetical protein